MDNPIRVLFQKLTERIFGVIAGSIGRAVFVSSTLYDAEQQSVLEDLAREYESEGKQELADQLRLAAKHVAGEDPTRAGVKVYQQLMSSIPETPHLPAPEQSATPSRRRRSRRSTANGDNSAKTQEESNESS